LESNNSVLRDSFDIESNIEMVFAIKMSDNRPMQQRIQKFGMGASRQKIFENFTQKLCIFVQHFHLF